MLACRFSETSRETEDMDRSYSNTVILVEYRRDRPISVLVRSETRSPDHQTVRNKNTSVTS